MSLQWSPVVPSSNPQHLNQQDPVKTMQKTGLAGPFIPHSWSCLVWQRFYFWMWSLEGSHSIKNFHFVFMNTSPSVIPVQSRQGDTTKYQDLQAILVKESFMQMTYLNTWILFVFGWFSQTEYYSYSYSSNFSNRILFVFVFRWFSKTEYRWEFFS